MMVYSLKSSRPIANEHIKYWKSLIKACENEPGCCVSCKYLIAPPYWFNGLVKDPGICRKNPDKYYEKIRSYPEPKCECYVKNENCIAEYQKRIEKVKKRKEYGFCD